MGPAIDIKGERFGRLVAMERFVVSDDSGRGRTTWKCVCDCGSENVMVNFDRLRAGITQSCGCLHREAITKTTHGHARDNHVTPTYRSWQECRKRCNKSGKFGYEYYGGRGIRVCEEWNEFENFLRDMGERPHGCTLDRIDVNGDYCKENCRWSTRKEQANNRSGVVKVTYNGRLLSIADYLKESGTSRTTFYRLRNKGMSPQEIVDISA